MGISRLGPAHPSINRWMFFVDGENITLRAQCWANDKGLKIPSGFAHMRDVYLWNVELPPVAFAANLFSGHQLHARAVRAIYYTSAYGDDEKLASIRTALHAMAFQPEVFKKVRKDQKAKAVDLSLARDLLTNAFYNNYDVAVLATSDGDFVPIVREVQRLGKVVLLVTCGNEGLSEELRLSTDGHLDIAARLTQNWGPLRPVQEGL